MTDKLRIVQKRIPISKKPVYIIKSGNKPLGTATTKAGARRKFIKFQKFDDRVKNISRTRAKIKTKIGKARTLSSKRGSMILEGVSSFKI